MGRARGFLEDQLRQAIAAGHLIDLVPVNVKGKPKISPQCRCGWEGRPRPTKTGAQGLAMTHVGDLAAAGFPAVPGVSLPRVPSSDRSRL